MFLILVKISFSFHRRPRKNYNKFHKFFHYIILSHNFLLLLLLLLPLLFIVVVDNDFSLDGNSIHNIHWYCILIYFLIRKYSVRCGSSALLYAWFRLLFFNVIHELLLHTAEQRIFSFCSVYSKRAFNLERKKKGFSVPFLFQSFIFNSTPNYMKDFQWECTYK